MAIDQKPDAVVMTENLFTLLLRLAALVLTPRANRGSSEYIGTRAKTPRTPSFEFEVFSLRLCA
jgi:hypothetical protein